MGLEESLVFAPHVMLFDPAGIIDNVLTAHGTYKSAWDVVI